MENLKENEKIISIIFESGASALYETIDQNTGQCNNVEKYTDLRNSIIAEYSKNFVTWNLPENKPDTDREILAICKKNQKLKPYIVRFYPEKNKYYIEEGRLSHQVDIVKWQEIPSFL